MKFNKIIKYVLAISMLSLYIPTITINAKESNGNEQLNQQELKVLDELYELDPNFTYEGELVSVSKKVQAMETKNSYGNQLARGAIGSNYMTIYITASRVNDSGKDTFNITATATWKLVPAFRMQDAFALAWGGNFALINSTATASYKGIGVLKGKTNLITQTPNVGVGYSVECSHYYGQALDWVRINAKISKKNSSGIANVSAAYSHSKIALGGPGISIGKNATISFNFMGLYDEMASYTSFQY